MVEEEINTIDLAKGDIISSPIVQDVQIIKEISISIIFSAVAVASTTVLLIIPNLETLSLIFFIVGIKYGIKTSFSTVITSWIIFEFFATQFYSTGGPIVFFLKLPPFLLIALVGSLLGSDYRKINAIKDDDASDSLVTVHPLIFGLIGLILTINYDIITSLFILTFVPSFEAFFVNFVLGIPMLLFHQFTNFILFSWIPRILIVLEKADSQYN